MCLVLLLCFVVSLASGEIFLTSTVGLTKATLIYIMFNLHMLIKVTLCLA